jgi:hypothetical protein
MFVVYLEVTRLITDYVVCHGDDTAPLRLAILGLGLELRGQ